MLPRPLKLPKKEGFGGFKKKNKDGPILAYFKENGGGPSRFGISISRKTEASAVQRNKIKRKIYSWLSEIKTEGSDYLLVVLPGFKGENPKEAREKLEKILKIK